MTNRNYYIAEGASVKAKGWLTKEMTWKDFISTTKSHTVTTPESMKEYVEADKATKCRIKDVGGFVGGKIVNGDRKKENIYCRSILSLDIDDGTADTLNLLKKRLNGVAHLIYSTHSATPEKPRYRVCIPLSRDVYPSDYVRIAEAFMREMSEIVFDCTSSQAERLMFWPSYSKDATPVIEESDGEPLKVERYLKGSSFASHSTDTTQRQSNGERISDPREKKGVIGAFCRCYSISQAIAKFLPDYYKKFSGNRYTYVNGSTEGGLVVYDDLFCYSNHSTDPICGMECNAFDMVRLHLFNGADSTEDEKRPMNKRPSYIKMMEICENDKVFSDFQRKEKNEKLKEDYGDIEESNATWMDKLERFGKNGQLKPTINNIMAILENDESLKEKIKRNIFEGKDVVTGKLPWDNSFDGERFWKNEDYSNLIVYFGKKYELQSKDMINICFDAEMSKHKYHPLREYFKKLEWDKKPRLETLFIDFLGAEDTKIIRQFTRKHLIAGVMRIKTEVLRHYDCVIILIGTQGIGKSTLLRKLANGYYCDYVGDIETKEAVENIQGKHIVSMDEMESLVKSKIEAQKAYISRDSDRVRMAYARCAEDYPRQCIFFATTNDRFVLKDMTGNRRYYPIECVKENATKSVFKDFTQEYIDQIWAEAQYYYDEGESYILDADMWREMENLQNAHTEYANDERIQVIEAFLDKKLPYDWDKYEKKQRQEFFTTNKMPTPCEMTRTKVCALEIANECLGINIGNEKTKYNTRNINALMKYVTGWRKTKSKYERNNVYGRQNFYERIEQENDDLDDL